MKPSAWFLVFVVVLIAAWDLAALHLGGTPHTITGVVRDAADRWPLLTPLAAAVSVLLFGHLFLGWF